MKEGKKERKRKTMKVRNRGEQNIFEDNTAICFIRGMAIAYAITCIIFIGFGILLTYTDISEDMLPMVSLGCTAISAAVAGYDWAACRKSKGLLWGIVAGGAYTVLLFLITSLAGSGLQLELSGLMTAIVALAGGGIGGILGVNRKK